MALATLTSAVGSAAVTGGRVTFPLEGAWEAEVTLDAADADVFTGSVTLDVGGVPLVGQGAPASDEGGQVSVLVTAGAAGLGVAVDAKHYKPPVTRRVVLDEALGVGGELLSPLSDVAALAGVLPQWTRVAGTVKDAVRAVLRSSGAAWRHLIDGTVWVGEETWLPFSGDTVLESEEPTQKVFTIAAESAAVLPGYTFRDQRITWAEYTLDGARVRGRLSYRTPAAPAVLPEYATPWVATVVGQNADETLELKSNDTRFPPMSRIPIRAGLPGVVSATVPVGSVCIVEFENGDPARPVATGWLSGSATALAIDVVQTIKLGRLATAFAARADLVDANFQTLVGLLSTSTVAGNGAPLAIVFSPQQTAATKVMVE